MNESVRKRKSLWDMKQETKHLAEIDEKNAWPRKDHHDSFHGSRWCDLEPNNASKSKDRSRWPSRETLQGYTGVPKDDFLCRDRHEIPETMRAQGGDNSYRKSMSPAFDRWGQQNRGCSADNSWSQSCRYRGRDRSRSRGRGRRRSRSRSGARSRSRSWSPFHDRRNASYEWGDRRSGSGLSSQTCRNFAAGKCRRGNQCRFLHQDNLNNRDSGHSENDMAESWRNRAEHGGATKYDNRREHEDGPWEKVSDGYYGEDEPLRNSSKATNFCKDFLKGKCHRGASCRYSHHCASDDNCDGANRNAFFDHGCKREPHKSSKILCRYFAMGKCHRDDCRFSHDSSTSANLEGKSRDDRWSHTLDDKNKSWKGPKWDDATGASDAAKSIGWDSRSDQNLNSVNPTTAEKRSDEWKGHSLEHEIRTWASPMWKEKATERNECLSHHQGSGSNGTDKGSAEFMGMEKLIDGEEAQLIAERSQPHTLDGISIHVDGKYITQEVPDHHLATTAVQPKVSESSHILLHHGQRRHNIVTDGSNVLNEVRLFGNPLHQVLIPEQSFYQNGDVMRFKPFSSSSGSDQSQDVLSENHLNEHGIDLNGPIQHVFTPLNPQNQTQNHQEEAVKTTEMLEFKVPQVSSEVHQNVIFSEQVAQITNVPGLLTQILGNEQQLPQLYAPLNISNATGMVSSLPNSAFLVPPIDILDVQTNLAPRSQQYGLIGDGIEPSKSSKSCQPPEFLSNSIEQKNEMPMEQLSTLSTLDPDSGKLHQSGVPDKFYESPKLKQQEPVVIPEVNNNNKSVAERCKQEQENIHLENVEANEQVEEGSSGKDEKGMRLFKIALVDFVKEILKPKWKEGQMSREVHKTIVKKVVDKVTSTIQGVHVPKTQDKIDQYLSFSKPKITKLVQAYVERFLKS